MEEQQQLKQQHHRDVVVRQQQQHWKNVYIWDNEYQRIMSRSQ